MIADRRVLSLWFVLGCAGEQDHRPSPPPSDGPEQEEQTDSSDSGAETDPVQFEGADVPVSATFHDEQRSDEAGSGLWVGDLDADGMDEVLVGAPNDWYQVGLLPGGGNRVRSSVYLLDGATSSGALSDVAVLNITGWMEYDFFGDTVVGLPGEGLIGVGSDAANQNDFPLYLYAASARGEVASDAWVARIHLPGLYNFPARAADCSGLGTATALCLSGNAGSAYDDSDGAGRVLIFDGPLRGTLPTEAARTDLIGDPWDQATILRTGADLDGDGRNDLLVGSIGPTKGRVALVSDPPDGDQNLWSVAFATFTGTEGGISLGIGLAMGDLDGDGHTDVFAGESQACVFLGPFAGDRTADGADVTVVGTVGHSLGYSGVIADLDGDGAADLAVGQPWPNPLPGRVFVFEGPSAGSYLDADADLRVTSGTLTEDSFGFQMEVGDVDGDDRADLLISAPNDDLGATSAGAVHLLLGSSID